MKVVFQKSRNFSGVMLVECIVYIAVFAIITGIATAAFYMCWNQSKAVVYATDEITAALRAGEKWRADIRGASGPISVERTGEGEQVRIPEHDQTIVYRFSSGEVRREVPSLNKSDPVLQNVNSSAMSSIVRAGVAGWRWELDMAVRRPETQLPLLFTFEAAQKNP